MGMVLKSCVTERMHRMEKTRVFPQNLLSILGMGAESEKSS